MSDALNDVTPVGQQPPDDSVAPPPRRQITIRIERVEGMVACADPYILCICNHQEFIFRYKEVMIGENDGSGHGFNNPVAANVTESATAAVRSMNMKPIHNAIWDATAVFDIKSEEVMYWKGWSIIKLFVFDRLTRKSFRGHATLSVSPDGGNEQIQRLRLHPGTPSDWVSGEIVIQMTQTRYGLVNDDFDLTHIDSLQNLNYGTKGDVHLVRDTRSGRLMAMKTVARNFKRTPIPVRHFSTSADQSFLLRPRYVLQPPGSTHILVDYVHGGELFQKRWPRGQFTEEQIRFSLSEVLLALGDLHRSGVQDYDLRPKKVLLDARGHVVLLDFGLVQTAEMYFERTSEKSYTPPEILSGGEIDRRGNFWALGVMLYEMSVLGINQLHDIKAKKINQMIEEGDIRFPPLGFLSDEGKDLCRRLLVRDPWARLGSRDGVLEIMKHTFFSSVDWTSLRQKRNIPPWEQVFSLPFVTAVKFERVATHIQSKEAKNEPKVSNEPDSPTILRPDDVSSDFNVSGDQNIPVEDKLGLSVDSNSLSSYRTALSSLGRGTFATPPSRYQSFDPGSGPIKDGLLSQMLRNKKPLSSLHSTSKSTYSTLLRDKGLLLPPSEQLDWSGKGQHVEFALGEEIPLKPLAAIGHGGSAIVDGVLCRRIKLARKTMVCSRRQKLEDVINEVEHLQRLRHPHIIQLVGSYLQGKKFAILLYPVAEWNLSSFFELCGRENTNSTWPLTRQACLTALAGFSQCLAHALSYVHSNTMKHLDIKPQNVLVRRVDKYKEPFRVYLADFGISKSFAADEVSQTDSLIARSRKYCSPEVYDGEPRGRSADIFSMGCVLLEMATISCDISLEEFADYRSEGSEDDDSFHANLKQVQEWIERLRLSSPEGIPWINNMWKELHTISEMLKFEPQERPLASEVLMMFGGPRDCCTRVRESYEAARPEEI